MKKLNFRKSAKDVTVFKENILCKCCILKQDIVSEN